MGYFKYYKLYAGWNLGNSLDSNKNGVGDETYWGNSAINQQIMNGVKAQGFKLIRIPITWTGHIGAAPDYTVAPARLDRVAQVVDMANKAGLKAIINVHHDGSTPNETSETAWLSIKKSVADPAQKAEITARFTALWEQIAAKFKDYGDWLIFESMNEIHDGGWGWSAAFRTAEGVQAQFEILNEWNQVFTDAVRASGGKNATRFLVIPSYATKPGCTYPGGKVKYDHPVNNVGGYFQLPTDSVKDRLIVSFHYYEPSEFGIQGRQASWGSETDRQKTIDDFAPFKPHFVDKGVPVIIGECGAVLQLRPSDPAAEALARQSRLAYLTHIFSTAGQYGLVPVYWDNGVTSGGGEKFGLIKRQDGQPNSNESRALLEAMIRAVK
jgi:endoglucanase